jgi:hypothetical protein
MRKIITLVAVAICAAQISAQCGSQVSVALNPLSGACELRMNASVPGISAQPVTNYRDDGTSYVDYIIQIEHSEKYNNCLMKQQVYPNCITSYTRVAYAQIANTCACNADLPGSMVAQIIEYEDKTLEGDLYQRISGPTLKRDCFDTAFGLGSIPHELFVAYLLPYKGYSQSTTNWKEARIGLHGQKFILFFRHASYEFSELSFTFPGCNGEGSVPQSHLMCYSKWGAGSVLQTRVEALEKGSYGNIRYFK